MFHEVRRKVEEVHIFLEEDQHNTIIKEDAKCLEPTMHREEYIARGAMVCVRL
jgi:hypothetical protein